MDYDKSVGAVWKRTTKKGDLFLSMQLEIDGKKLSLVAWGNRNKKLPKHPDFEVFLSKPYDRGSTTPVQSTPSPEPVIQTDPDVGDIRPEDVPF